MRQRAFAGFVDDHVINETFPSVEELSEMLEMPFEIGEETARHFVTLKD